MPPPAVSAVVPLCSPAPHFRSCIDKLLALDPAVAEIVVCVSRSDPEAMAAARWAAAASDTVRIVEVETHASPNPKVALLASGIDKASNDLILQTDDNVLSPAPRLGTHHACLGGSVGIVSAASVGVTGPGRWSAVDVAFMNGYFSRLHLAADCIGLSFVTGGTILYSRADIRRSGGLLATGATLCEDAALQVQLEAIGRQAVLCDEPVLKAVGRRSLRDVWHRHLRWFNCRFRHAPFAFLLEAVLSAGVAVLAAAVAAPALGLPSVGAALATMLLLLAMEWALLRAKGWPVGRRFVEAWLLREAMVLPLWVCCIRARSVRWRGREFPILTTTPSLARATQ